MIVDTADPKQKLWIQVKTGYSPSGSRVYLTQCTGEKDLSEDKFVADFVVFVNIDQKIGTTHQHDGTLGFDHLTFYVVPRDVANRVYREAIVGEYNRPLKTGGQRKLGNLAVVVPLTELQGYKDAWWRLQEQVRSAT